MKIDLVAASNFVVEATLFTVFGNLNGRIVNKLDLVINPTMFQRKSPFAPEAATLFCALFITIDYIAKKSLRNSWPDKTTDLPINIGCMVFTFFTAHALHQSIQKLLRYPALSLNSSLVLTISTIFLHVLCKRIVKLWNEDPA